jgi:hypothetical protein
MVEQSEQLPEIDTSVQPFLDEIAERLFSGHAAIMVGAGFSRNAVPKKDGLPQFPTWVELGDAFYEKLYGEEKAEIGEKKRYLSPLKLAFQVEANFGRPTLDKIIADRVPDLYHEPSRLHEKLLELPWQDVFTTNYDTLLERASKKVIKRKYSFIVNTDDLIYAEKPRIIKLHGSMPSTKPFIITEENYRRYPKDFAPFVNMVQQSLLENALCMIGFSGDDPNFLQWIGWIRDNIGTGRASKMYFIGIDPLSPVDRTIFDQRHIVYIDASKCTQKVNPGAKIEAVIDYLASKENKDSGIYWSATKASLFLKAGKPTDRIPQIQEVVSQWRDEREKYPGWCITPVSRRKSMWSHTNYWVGALRLGEALPDFLDLDFFYELNWRLERCLCPLFDDTAATMRDCLGRYWPFTDHNLLSQSTNLQENANKIEQGHDTLRDRWCTLALSLLRYYREEGLSEGWTLFASILKDHEDFLSAEQRASFAYERCLYNLFEVNLKGLDHEFESWPDNSSLPFWEAKRAGLLAERGRIDEAVKLLDRSIVDIRAKQNLRPISSDFTLVSQEAYVMVLRRYVGEASSYYQHAYQEERSITTEYSDRWNELKQYLCDPWEELSTFETKLEAEPRPYRKVTTEYGFDIGSISRTTHIASGPDPQALDGYSFLLFLEETAIPVSLPFISFGKKAAINALPRIAPYSSHWALCEAARIGDPKVADQLFDRRALSRLDRTTVDEYITMYIQTAKRIGDSIEQSSGLYQTSLGNFATKVIPEILSRLCCKSSPESREKILLFIEEVYRAKNKALYSGVNHLIKRLVDSACTEKLDAYIPRFLEFEIPQDEDILIEKQFINPLSVVLDSEYAAEGRKHHIVIEPKTIEKLFQNAASQIEKTRTWSILSLFVLQRLDVLDEQQKKRFGKLVWVDDSGNKVPKCDELYSFAFLELPIPEGIDAKGRFKKYILDTPFPIIGDKHKAVSLAGGNFPIIGDILGLTKYLAWTDSEIHILFERLIAWWDSDKQYLNVEEEDEDSSGFSSIPQEARARLKRLPDIMANVISCPLCRSATDLDMQKVTRLIAEAKATNMPYLKMKLAFASLFPEEDADLLREISEALSSSRREAIVDALNAMLFSLDLLHESSLLSTEELEHLLAEVGNIVRWRYEPGLVSAMNTVGYFIPKKPVCFNEELKEVLLAGLKELEHETDPTTLEAADIPKKLEIRQSAAALSYTIFKSFYSTAEELPQSLQDWKAICASPEEFAEIRNRWE